MARFISWTRAAARCTACSASNPFSFHDLGSRTVHLPFSTPNFFRAALSFCNDVIFPAVLNRCAGRNRDVIVIPVDRDAQADARDSDAVIVAIHGNRPAAAVNRLASAVFSPILRIGRWSRGVCWFSRWENWRQKSRYDGREDRRFGRRHRRYNGGWRNGRCGCCRWRNPGWRYSRGRHTGCRGHGCRWGAGRRRGGRRSIRRVDHGRGIRISRLGCCCAGRDVPRRRRRNCGGLGRCKGDGNQLPRQDHGLIPHAVRPLQFLDRNGVDDRQAVERVGGVDDIRHPALWGRAGGVAQRIGRVRHNSNPAAACLRQSEKTGAGRLKTAAALTGSVCVGIPQYVRKNKQDQPQQNDPTQHHWRATDGADTPGQADLGGGSQQLGGHGDRLRGFVDGALYVLPC